MTLRDVLEKYFKDERTLYFNSSDRLRSIEGDDTFLRYRLDGGVELYFSGDNGEVCFFFTSDPVALDQMLELVIFGRSFSPAT